MPSASFRRWTTTRANALDEIERAHASVGGAGRGRGYATQQINQAYAVMLASQFQGFCRDLHSECVDHLIRVLAPPPALRLLLHTELVRGRQLDRGNAQPGSLGADFGRFGVSFWDVVERHDRANAARRARLEMLNSWRNAIAHQDFDPAKLGGSTTLRLAQVRRWRTTCRRLAWSFDEVMRLYLSPLTGASPW